MLLGLVLAALSIFRFAPAASHGGQAIGPSGSIHRNDPAEVFREFTFQAGASPAVKFAELDPKATFKFVGEHAWGATMPRHVPRPIELDLTQAVRAELSVEYWGGHIGTSGQQFQVNSNGWVDLPQPVGTPAAPQRFYRTLLGNNAVPIPLAHLRQGTNQIQFAAGSQIAYSFGFGFYWIYDFTVRVFYDNARPHPTGEIVSPKPSAAFGDILDLEARASSPNGPITRVEFIGEYDDFDWDGDGVWREWQFTTHHGVLQHHLGTATNAPWRVRFDARWLPDQSQPARVRARITDAPGLVWLTPPVENLVQKRERRSVRMCKPVNVPENFCSRDSKVSPTCTFILDADLAKAKAARLVLSTWSANVDDDSVHELRLNGQRLASRFGQFHNYSFNALNVPLSLLKAGTNEITLFSTFKGHAIEVNWPGPVLLLELATPPVAPPRKAASSANDVFIRAAEPIRATFWLVEPSMTVDVVKARADALFRSGINTTIIGGGRHHYLHNDLPYIEDYIAAVKLIVAACHARGIKVIEHHSVVLTTRKDYAEEHRNWVQLDFATGEPSVWPEYQTWAFCPNNTEFREHYWKIAADIVSRTGVDGLMSDDTVFHHGCCCAACAKWWKEEVGGDIREAYEKSRKSGTPEWRTFNEVRRRWYQDFRAWVRQRQASEFPGKTCVSLAGSINSAWGTQTHGGAIECGLSTSDVSLWEAYNPADFYSWRRLSTEAAALAEAARVRGIIPVCLPYADTAPKRDVFDPEEETFMWGLAQAYGMPFSLSRVFLTGLTENDSTRDYFVFERDRLKTYCGSQPGATIGIMFSHCSRDNDPAYESLHSAPAMAWAESLADSFIPYRAVTEETLDKGLPAELRTLVLPNVFAVSDKHLAAIERFVSQGGKLIATYLTATADESGAPRLDTRRARLEKLLGVRFKSADLATAGSSVPQADFEITSASRSHADPDVYVHRVGKGRAYYISSLVERSTFQDWMNEGQPYSDPRDMKTSGWLASLAADVTPVQPLRIRCSDPKTRLLTAVRKQEKRLLLYVVNTAGASLAKGQTVPTPSKVVWAEPVDLTLSLGKAAKAVRVISLDSKEDKVIEKPGSSITIQSPKRFELVVIDL